MTDHEVLARRFFDAVVRQDAAGIVGCCHPGAVVRWHNTGEAFSIAEFARVNCDYPGSWCGVVERVEWAEPVVILAGRVHSVTESHHVVSFLRIEDGLIGAVDEYWGEDGPPPPWRSVTGAASGGRQAQAGGGPG